MKYTEDIQEPAEPEHVGVVHESKAVADEVKRYLRATNQVKGRAYARAMVEKMDRDRAAGRWE